LTQVFFIFFIKKYYFFNFILQHSIVCNWVLWFYSICFWRCYPVVMSKSYIWHTNLDGLGSIFLTFLLSFFFHFIYHHCILFYLCYEISQIYYLCHTRTSRRPIKKYLDNEKRTDIWHLVLLGENVLFKESPPSIMVTRNLNWSTVILWYGTGYAKGKMLSPLKRLT
jgi:hypothetical protein